MQENPARKYLPLVLPLLIALISVFILSGYASSAQFHADSLAGLEEKQATVLELSAASAAASAAITLIPGDTATPIADKLADLSSHFLVVLCAIFLEKYLLTITGFVTFKVLIPLACGAYILSAIFGWRGLRALACRLAAFGLLIFLVIPVSLRISDMIETTYQASIDATIESAKETADAVESAASDENAEDEGFWEGLISSITDGITGVTSGIADKVGGMVNDFMEALAVMLVTSCVIPVLVLLSFIWFAKILLAVDLSVILAVAAVFGNLSSALYGIVALYLSSFVMDKALYGLDNAKVAYIISDSYEAITQALIHDIDRGVTILHGQGAWTGAEKKVLMVAFKQKQIVEIKRMVNGIDPNAFLVVCDAHEVLGDGFRAYQENDI